MVALACNLNPCMIQYTAPCFQSEQLLVNVLSTCGVALQYIDSAQTEELCKIAVQQSGYAIQFVHNEYLTPDVCMLAVQNDGGSLVYIPPSKCCVNIYEAAIRQNPQAILYVPSHLITEYMEGGTLRI